MEILRTKLNRPHFGKDTLSRPHLLKFLAENQGLPLTLISAPAGYGKSTLASQWVEKCDSPSAWLSLD
jgi:LuxR family maltose regulon positive regulatory protein